jgi:hypothetical protein
MELALVHTLENESFGHDLALLYQVLDCAACRREGRPKSLENLPDTPPTGRGAGHAAGSWSELLLLTQVSRSGPAARSQGSCP